MPDTDEADPDGREKVGRGPTEKRTERGAKEGIGGKATDRLGPEKDKQGGQEAGTQRGSASEDTVGLRTVQTEPRKDGPGPSRLSALEAKGKT